MIYTTLLFALTINLTHAMPSLEEVQDRRNKFRAYNAKHNKKPQNLSEFNYRFKIYSATLDVIEKFNKRAESWKMGENIFTDMTETERKNYVSKFNVEEVEAFDLMQDETDNIQSDQLLGRRLTDSPYATFTPQSMDWKPTGVITDVKDQGSCGSCWAFAVSAMVESAYIQKGFADSTIDLSEQQLVDCTNDSVYKNYGCGGGSTTSALSYFINKGVSTESAYPYVGKDQTCQIDSGLKVTSGFILRTRSLTTLLNRLKNGPAAVAYYVASDFYLYESGIYNHKASCEGVSGVNHAVLAVGYNLDPNAPYIEFKNSWGTQFGENGFFRMSMDLVDSGYGPCNLLRYSMSVFAIV